MRAAHLMKSIAVRTKLPHEEVKAVMLAMRDIVMEQLSMYEYVIIPGLGKLGVRRKKTGIEVIPYFASYAALANVVGTAFEPVGNVQVKSIEDETDEIEEELA